MSLLPLIGGLLGFGLGLGLGLLRQNPLPVVLLRAAIGAYVGAVLMRWWMNVWVKNLQRAMEEQGHE